MSGRIAPSLTSDGRVLPEIHLLHNNQTLGDNNNLWLHKSLVWDCKQANCGAPRRRSGRRHRSQGDSAGGVCSSIFAAVDVNTIMRGWCVLVHTVRSLWLKTFLYFFVKSCWWCGIVYGRRHVTVSPWSSWIMFLVDFRCAWKYCFLPKVPPGGQASCQKMLKILAAHTSDLRWRDIWGSRVVMALTSKHVRDIGDEIFTGSCGDSLCAKLS